MGIVVEERFEVDAGGAAVLAWLGDPSRVVRCFPAAEVGATTDEGIDVGFTLPLAAATTRFASRARVSADTGARSARIEATGEETGGGATATLALDCRVEETAGGSDVVIRGEVSIASEQHAASALDAAANELVQRIVDCMFRTLAGPPMTTPPRRAREDLSDLDLGLDDPPETPQSPVAAASLQDTALNLPAARRPLPPPDPSVDVPQLQRTMSIPAAKRPAVFPPPRSAAARDRTAVTPRPPDAAEGSAGGWLARLGALLGKVFRRR